MCVVTLVRCKTVDGGECWQKEGRKTLFTGATVRRSSNGRAVGKICLDIAPGSPCVSPGCSLMEGLRRGWLSARVRGFEEGDLDHILARMRHGDGGM